MVHFKAHDRMEMPDDRSTVIPFCPNVVNGHSYVIGLNSMPDEQTMHVLPRSLSHKRIIAP